MNENIFILNISMKDFHQKSAETLELEKKNLIGLEGKSTTEF